MATHLSSTHASHQKNTIRFRNGISFGQILVSYAKALTVTIRANDQIAKTLPNNQRPAWTRQSPQAWAAAASVRVGPLYCHPIFSPGPHVPGLCKRLITTPLAKGPVVPLERRRLLQREWHRAGYHGPVPAIHAPPTRVAGIALQGWHQAYLICDSCDRYFRELGRSHSAA
jgi:hypothetical protein